MSGLPDHIDPSNLDDIIGLAAEMAESEPERLSAEELRHIAAELEIPEQYLRPAIDELRRRRAALLAAEHKQAELRKKIALGFGLALVALFIWMLIVQSGLRATWHQVEGRRAQLINVMDRQAATQKQWAQAPAGDDRAAELSGAENRVRVERQRYDKAVTDYNTQVDGLVSGVARVVFRLPSRAPLSNEVETW